MGITYEPLQPEVAERIDNLFGHKNCLIEVNPGKVLMPPRYEEIGDRIRMSEVRPDDVWVVSYPRTGSTWAQEMVWCIGNDLDFERAKMVQQFRTPLIELTAVMSHDEDGFTQALGDSVDLVASMPSPRFIKSHLTWDLLPEKMSSVKPKVVYVARNPKDMCVSYYHYCQLVHRLTGGFEEFAELFMQDKAPVGPIWRHILSFWEKRDEPNVLFLKYEDMKRDLPSQIRRTAEFLGKKIDDESVEKLVDYLSFDKMKKNPAVNLEVVMAQKYGEERMANADAKFIRKGQVGDYKNHMSDEMIAKFDAWTEENLAGTGLSFE